MIVTFTLPVNLATAVELDAGRRGQTVASFLTDRLADAYALRPPVPSASRVPLIPSDTLEIDTDD